MKNKNIKLSIDFERYCKAHPEERFWQAIRNWSGAVDIIMDGHDTFYFEDKNK